jgi:hypothetical protein
MIKLLHKPWIHLLIWVVMLVYFFAMPALYTRTFTKIGRPLESRSIPAESNKVIFAVDGLEPDVKDGEKVYNLFGWALMVPGEGKSVGSLVREVVLISDEESYFFPVTSVYRTAPALDKLAGLKVNPNNLGFYAYIADDTMKPGKYRVGIIFRDTTSGAAYYHDKPLYYVIKTPNSLDLRDK